MFDRKYVNMADVNFSPATLPLSGPPARAHAGNRAREPLYDLIELFFFAYRDFVGGADAMLERYGFGRAHHRVLHFVDRNPGLKVADLLEILGITKQSLARVLKELIDQSFIAQREGEEDRRQRLLFTTPQGAALAREVALLQSERIARALDETGAGTHAEAAAFLFALVDPEHRASVEGLVYRSDHG